ncbi:MAG: HIT family protein [Bacteroidales bacterium]|nr:HIT family protein [Bacteroidales bacterium]MCF0211426.1 HIT family protein [Bacteroidales bacterium]MCF0212140.1 HIT family protein [Bacteroidales bacterium]
MASIFSRIVAGEIPCYKVAETKQYLAFLDVNPVARGHVLCIPKEELDYYFELPDELYFGLHVFARRVARALKDVCPCEKVGEAVIGLDVRHAHVHLIPLNTPGDMDFSHHVEVEPEEMQRLADEIAKVYWDYHF